MKMTKMNIKQMKTDLQSKISHNSPMRNMLIALGTLFALIIIYHFLSSAIQKFQLEREANAPIIVSTAKVEMQDWQPRLLAVGNLFSRDGIDVTAEVDGIISQIHIKSNQDVKAGDPIIQFNAEPDIAALEGLKAEAELARLTFDRSKEQFAFNAVSAQDLEESEFDMRIAKADADEQQALVDLKTVRAAFDGQVGISKLSPGQFIAAGDPIVSLQNLATLYVYFYVPEQNLSKLKVGQDVILRTESYKNETFPGKISAIAPLSNNSTHNIELEATIDNANKKLLPGMYTQIEVITGEPEKYLTIAQSAISYNPYGNYVYVVTKDKKKLSVKQRFISLGEARGDQVIVTKGLQAGDEIVSSGQIKLKDESKIEINNEIQPLNDASPIVTNE